MSPLTTRYRYETLCAGIEETRIWESKNEKLLGLIIKRNLNLDDYLLTLCKKAVRKLSATSRTFGLISFEKKEFCWKCLWNHSSGFNCDSGSAA